jgi:imidazolonepropionase
MSALLVRDLRQVVSPAHGSEPLRGPALRDVRVIESGYVLCREGLIESVGPMRELGAVAGDIEELDGRGMIALPGLVDCHTHACFAGDRVQEFDLRSSGASYEELHAAGGGILSTVRATRAAGRELLDSALARHKGWMLAHGTTTFEA